MKEVLIPAFDKVKIVFQPTIGCFVFKSPSLGCYAWCLHLIHCLKTGVPLAHFEAPAYADRTFYPLYKPHIRLFQSNIDSTTNHAVVVLDKWVFGTPFLHPQRVIEIKQGAIGVIAKKTSDDKPISEAKPVDTFIKEEKTPVIDFEVVVKDGPRAVMAPPPKPQQHQSEDVPDLLGQSVLLQNKPNKPIPFEPQLKAPINLNRSELLKTMGLFKTKDAHQKSSEQYRAAHAQHPCCRYVADTMLSQVIANLPREPTTLWDVGAKYVKYRKLFNKHVPWIRYRGVRCGATVSHIDAAYISTHPPHPDDLILESYDQFYEGDWVNPKDCLLFIDSFYYVTDKQVESIHKWGANLVFIVGQIFPCSNGVYRLFGDEATVHVMKDEISMKTNGNLSEYRHQNQFPNGIQDVVEYPNCPGHKWFYGSIQAHLLQRYSINASGEYIELDAQYIYQQKGGQTAFTSRSSLVAALKYTLEAPSYLIFEKIDRGYTDYFQTIDQAECKWNQMMNHLVDRDQVLEYLRPKFYFERVLVLMVFIMMVLAGRFFEDSWLVLSANWVIFTFSIILYIWYQCYQPHRAPIITGPDGNIHRDYVLQIYHDQVVDYRISRSLEVIVLDKTGGGPGKPRLDSEAPYLREKPVEEIQFTNLDKVKDRHQVTFFSKGNPITPQQFAQLQASTEELGQQNLSGYNLVDQDGVAQYTYEWGTRAKTNHLAALCNRFFKIKFFPEEASVEKLRVVAKKLEKKLKSLKCPVISFDEYLEQHKKSWTPSKVQKYRNALNKQRMQSRVSKVPQFKLFLKKGEQYVTSSKERVLRGVKERSRLIWEPKNDTFGVLGLLNYIVIKTVSQLNGFCYCKTAEDYTKEFSQYSDSVCIDMDASANDGHQHSELKDVIVRAVYNALWEQIRVSVPDMAPEQVDKWKDLFLNQHYKAECREKDDLLYKVVGKGSLQSGHPMTTWYNTLSILMFHEVYLEEIPFPKDEFGLIKNRNGFGHYVSGDDQLVFTPLEYSTSTYQVLTKNLKEDRKDPALGRVCDPINFNMPGKPFSFISRFFKITDQVQQIRDPIKFLTHSRFYCGSNRTLTQDPESHSTLVGQCLKQSAGDSPLLNSIADARLRIGQNRRSYTQEGLKVLHYVVEDKTLIEGQEQLVIEVLINKFGFSYDDIYQIQVQMDNVQTRGETVVVPKSIFSGTKNMSEKKVEEKKVKKPLKKESEAYSPQAYDERPLVPQKKLEELDEVSDSSREDNVLTGAKATRRKKTTQQKVVPVPGNKLPKRKDYVKGVDISKDFKTAQQFNMAERDWLRTLISPHNYIGLRQPSKFPIPTAVTRLHGVGTQNASANGYAWFGLYPKGNSVLGIFADGNTSPTVYGALGTSIDSPFRSTSSTYPDSHFRVVSAGLRLWLTTPYIDSTGSFTGGKTAMWYSSATNLLDRITDDPGRQIAMASDVLEMTWQPIDSGDTLWESAGSDSITQHNYVFFQGNANAKISYEYTINYEFIPLQNYDIAGVMKAPLGSSSKVVKLVTSIFDKTPLTKELQALGESMLGKGIMDKYNSLVQPKTQITAGVDSPKIMVDQPDRSTPLTVLPKPEGTIIRQTSRWGRVGTLASVGLGLGALALGVGKGR